MVYPSLWRQEEVYAAFVNLEQFLWQQVRRHDYGQKEIMPA